MSEDQINVISVEEVKLSIIGEIPLYQSKEQIRAFKIEAASIVVDSASVLFKGEGYAFAVSIDKIMTNSDASFPTKDRVFHTEECVGNYLVIGENEKVSVVDESVLKEMYFRI